MRPAISHGSGRPPPKPPNRPQSFRGKQHEETEKVQLRKSSNKPVRPASVGSKNESTSKRKLEITIVSARPMSEVGFRGMAVDSAQQTKSEGNAEHNKHLMDMKMAAPTKLVPDRNSLPPKPNKQDSSPHQRPLPPVPFRKDVPQSHDSKTPPNYKASVSPMPRPRMNKSSPESPSPNSRSAVPSPESSTPIKPRKHMTLPLRPLPPSPSSDDEEPKVVIESPAKPQRTFEWSVDSESENVSQSSVANKPRRPTIIRPVKAKSIDVQKDNHSSPVENSISSLPKESLPPVPMRNFEKTIINNQNDAKNTEVECNRNVQNDVISKNEKNKNIPNFEQDTETSEKKKPPIAEKPKPSILPKPKLLHQANVEVEDQTEINSKIRGHENESESKKVRKPTIIRANVTKQTSGNQSVSETSEKTPDTVEDIPDYASIQKPSTEKTQTKPIISSSFSSIKPPPPVPAKRFTPPSLKSKDDLEILPKSDNLEVQNRPKPVARARPMSMMVTSSTRIESPMKPPPPSKGHPLKPSPPKPSPPSIANQKKSSPSTENPVKPPLPNTLRKSSLTNAEKTGMDAESPKQERVPPSRPLSVPRSKVTSDHDESSEDDQEESVKAKPVRPRMGPIRPSPRPIKSPLQDQSTRNINSKNSPTAREEAAPDLPCRPGPGHPLYHYMLKVPHGQAIHDFDGTNPEDLSFKANDIVILHKRIDEAWLHGQVDDVEGIFPQSFIHILRPFDDEIQMSSQAPLPVTDNVSDSDSSPCVSVKEKTDWVGTGPRCVARFDFEGEGAADLCFEEGDYIKLLERLDSEWMKGELYDKVGIFPMTFVEIIEELPALTSDAMNELVKSEETVDRLDKTDTKFTNTSESENIHNETISSPCIMCQAISDFSGESPDDLSFNGGDLIEIIGEIDENWLKGRLKNKEGIFPASFVIRLESPTSETTGVTPQGDKDDFGEAVYDFEGEHDNELSFKVGDKIRLGTIVDGAEDWQWGEVNGQSGIFPKAFVQPIS